MRRPSTKVEGYTLQSLHSRLAVDVCVYIRRISSYKAVRFADFANRSPVLMKLNKLTITEADIAKQGQGAKGNPVEEAINGSAQQRQIVCQRVRVQYVLFEPTP